jgi:hypothetical protein
MIPNMTFGMTIAERWIHRQETGDVCIHQQENGDVFGL